MAKMGRKPKNPSIHYSGVDYYRSKEGVYYSSASVTGVRRKLHVDVWEDAYGPIPNKHIIRFKDGNSDNITLANMVCELRAKHPTAEFEGVTYYKKPSGYYVCDRRFTKEGRERYLHRAVWKATNGDIPSNLEIHHIDHNKDNNSIDNLELLQKTNHASHHTRKRLRERDPSVLRGIKAAQEAAKTWHKSEEGRAWHREQAKKTIGLPVELEDAVCAHCGINYKVDPRKKKRGFCSANCQSAARRASGVDNETRTCVECGAEFVTNKYSTTATCGRSCGCKVSARKRSSSRHNG